MFIAFHNHSPLITMFKMTSENMLQDSVNTLVKPPLKNSFHSIQSLFEIYFRATAVLGIYSVPSKDCCENNHTNRGWVSCGFYYQLLRTN